MMSSLPHKLFNFNYFHGSLHSASVNDSNLKLHSASDQTSQPEHCKLVWTTAKRSSRDLCTQSSRRTVSNSYRVPYFKRLCWLAIKLYLKSECLGRIILYLATKKKHGLKNQFRLYLKTNEWKRKAIVDWRRGYRTTIAHLYNITSRLYFLYCEQHFSLAYFITIATSST